MPPILSPAAEPLQGWNDNIDGFSLHIWMSGWLQDPEEYKGDDLKQMINKTKKAAFTANSKKLLVKYALDVSKLRGVKTEKERAKTRSR